MDIKKYIKGKLNKSKDGGDVEEINYSVADETTDHSISKYLPTLLFIGIQRDINEKALKSYIFAIAKNSFSNIADAKFSIRKINKSEYIYEVHNGSDNLTYLPLIYQKLYIDKKNELILKAENQNIRVIKKPNGKIDSNTLLESNNRDEEAVVDYETNGTMIPLIKEGSELFIFSTLCLVITGILASVSYVTKYTMLNEDYSFTPMKDHSISPISFIQSLKFKDHSEYKYVKNIRYKDGKWSEEYGIVEKTEEDLNKPKNDDFESAKKLTKNKEVTHKSEPKMDVVKDEVVNEPISDEVLDISNIDNVAVVEYTDGQTVSFEEPVIEEPILFEETIMDKDSVVNENHSPLNKEAAIENAEQVEKVSESEPINEIANEQENSEDIVSASAVKDRFEIIDVKDLDNLDLSNLPENIVVEGNKQND